MNIDKLQDFMLLEREKCPWATTLTTMDMLKELTDEIQELREELERSPKNLENVAEEMADVFSDILLLMNLAVKNTDIKSIDDIISRALAKKIRRKGWLIEGKELTRQEASIYWYKAKESEKQNNI